jgi:hypothetical protein
MAAKNNREIVKEINVVSNPDAGTKYPKSKPDTSEDSLGNSYHRTPQPVRDAEVKTGVATKCMRQQAGKVMDNMSQGSTGINDEGYNES